jgi:prephenate dehydratase
MSTDLNDGRPTIAFSGEPGAFAEDAVNAYFTDPATLPVPGFREVFEAVTANRAQAGVLPIENLVNGTVRENYDLLLEHDLVIVGEVVVPVQLCLAALPGQRVEEIERVYSHIQALGQADRFLRTRPWSLLTTYNTAGAGKMIVDRGERASAAVLSPRAAGLFGLEILANGIQNVPDNRTRFVVVVRPGATLPPDSTRSATRTERPAPPNPPMRTTLVLALPNEPGALHCVLGIIAAAGVNMSKLESRPLHDRSWEYVFWVDLDCDADEPGAREALAAVAASVPMLRILGSYPRSEA